MYTTDVNMSTLVLMSFSALFSSSVVSDSHVSACPNLLLCPGSPSSPTCFRNMNRLGWETLTSRWSAAWEHSTPFGGADSRVIKSLDCGARGPGFESRCRWKVLGSDRIIRKYLSLWVCPEFGMRACLLFRFVLIELRHWGEPSAVLWVPV